MKWCALVVSCAVLAAACSGSEPGDHERITALRAAADRLDDDISDLESRVGALSNEWAVIAAGYTHVAEAYRSARYRYESAARTLDSASEAFAVAAQEWKIAAARWELYREIVMIVVASGADRRWSRSVGCRSISTSAFRRQLLARGVSLVGMDIDHIVPRALGGADDPANYQVIDSSLNRSLGKTWNAEKCLMAGQRRCAEAVAVSTRCGSYAGGGFW